MIGIGKIFELYQKEHNMLPDDEVAVTFTTRESAYSVRSDD